MVPDASTLTPRYRNHRPLVALTSGTRQVRREVPRRTVPLTKGSMNSPKKRCPRRNVFGGAQPLNLQSRCVIEGFFLRPFAPLTIMAISEQPPSFCTYGLEGSCASVATTQERSRQLAIGVRVLCYHALSRAYQTEGNERHAQGICTCFLHEVFEEACAYHNSSHQPGTARRRFYIIPELRPTECNSCSGVDVTAAGNQFPRGRCVIVGETTVVDTGREWQKRWWILTFRITIALLKRAFCAGEELLMWLRLISHQTAGDSGGPQKVV
jgi:hypothetical protein